MWRIQQVSPYVLVGIVVLGLAGLFGNGPLAWAHAERGTVAVAYDRLLLMQTPHEIEITIGQIAGDSVTFWIDSAYLRQVQIDRISPEPTAMVQGPDRTFYTVRVAPDANVAQITMQMRFASPGLFEASIGRGGEEPVTFGQFVYF